MPETKTFTINCPKCGEPRQYSTNSNIDQTFHVVCRNCGIYQVDIHPQAENEQNRVICHTITDFGNLIDDNCITSYRNLNPWYNKPFSEIESSNTTHILEFSELNLYFLYKALEFTKSNMIITEPYEDLMNQIINNMKNKK